MGLKSWLDRIRAFTPLLMAVCSLLAGCFFIATTKPGHTPDVWSHVYRISGMTNGDWLAKPVGSRSFLHNTTGNVGGDVDRAWLDYSWQVFDGYDSSIALPDSISPSDQGKATVALPYNNTATNSPVAYLPQLLVFGFGKLAGLSANATFYAAEVAMLLVFTLCLLMSLSVLPRWRIAMGLLLLVPVLAFHMRTAFTISADSMTQAIAPLFLCLVFSSLIQPPTKRRCASTAAVGLLLAMCKFIYAPLVALLLLLPLARKAGRTAPENGGRDRFVPAVSIAGVGASAAWLLAWMKLNGWYATAPMFVSYDAMLAKKHDLLTRPATIAAVLRSIAWSISHGQTNNSSQGGSRALITVWLGLTLLFALLLLATAVRTLGRSELLFCWSSYLLNLLIILLTYLALWLQYTGSGAVGVLGMQLRYFLPLVAGWGLCALTCMQALWDRWRTTGQMPPFSPSHH
ncbi:DUF2142 domain-containing protein [Bifidobacterium xylocopae]|nr:DUF2142 domain-containing protein [Bifidobacterium xylocopae]